MAVLPGRLAARTPGKSRLILLGTGGGPRPRKNRSASAQVIVAGESAYVVDCGDGVARQMVLANVPLTSLRHVFITHHHADHNADYGNLLLGAWTSGLRSRIEAWGPPPLVRITRLFLEMSATDIEARVRDEGRVALAPLVRAHEITRGGAVMSDENVRVSAAVVDHPPMALALAYRFDCADRSIVISGDTRPCEALVRLARGADVLVHEAMIPAAVERMAGKIVNAPRLVRSILGHHTSAEDAGRIAAEAGVKTLVLSHLVPADDPAITDSTWIEAARRHFAGEIVVGSDLLEL